jgi:AcrR family transcriptional regulator
MSNKNREKSQKRPYTQRARARRREEVHQRITKAAVDLHGSVGPAQTTISDIAKRAGVRRATVYNHFSSDSELFEACSSLWFSENPPPDPTVWMTISDPAERVKIALEAMYEYYSNGKEMLEKVLRDTPQVPALQEILDQKWRPLLEKMVETLAHGWDNSERDAELERRAILRVALNFFTWQTLAVSGLSNTDAANLVATWVQIIGTSPQEYSTGYRQE